MSKIESQIPKYRRVISSYVKETRSERRSGIPKMIWREVVSKDLQILNVNADMVSNKAEWRLKIHMADPNYSGILVLVDLFSLPNVKS